MPSTQRVVATLLGFALALCLVGFLYAAPNTVMRLSPFKSSHSTSIQSSDSSVQSSDFHQITTTTPSTSIQSSDSHQITTTTPSTSIQSSDSHQITTTTPSTSIQSSDSHQITTTTPHTSSDSHQITTTTPHTSSDSHKINNGSLPPSPLPRVYVVMSSTLDLKYSFHIPLAARAWIAIDVVPVLILFYPDFEESGIGNVILNNLPTSNMKVFHIRYPTEQSKTPLSQCLRIFASLLPFFRPEDYLLTSDIDIFPIDAEWFLPESIENDQERVFSFNGHCCGSFKTNETSYKHLPMHSILMSVQLWRQLVAGDEKFTVELEELSQYTLDRLQSEYPTFFNKTFTVQKGGNEGWFMDQHFVSRLLGDSSLNVTIRVPPPPIKQWRLDRWDFKTVFANDSYEEKLATSRYVDAHAPLFAHSEGMWPFFRRFLHWILPSDQHVEIDRYYSAIEVQLMEESKS